MGVIFQDPTAKFKCTLGDRSFTVAGRLQRYRTVYRTILGKRMILKLKRLIKTQYFGEDYSHLS